MLVTTIAPGRWLDAPAAASYLRMLAGGCPAGITSAGRTLDEQIAIFRDYYTTDYSSSAKTDRRTYDGQTWWRRPGKPSAATPGTSSARHVLGLALDLPEPARTWVTSHGAAYGWIANLVAGEPWHFEYQAARDAHAITTPPVSTAPQEDDDMIDARDLIATAYRQELGRDASEPELYPRLRRIAAGTTTLAQEVNDIDASTESNRYAVHQLYLQYLGRDGSVAEWDQWIASTGNNIDAIRAGVSGSPEAKQRATAG